MYSTNNEHIILYMMLPLHCEGREGQGQLPQEVKKNEQP